MQSGVFFSEIMENNCEKTFSEDIVTLLLTVLFSNLMREFIQWSEKKIAPIIIIGLKSIEIMY